MNCQARIDIVGGCLYCTLTKGEHGDFHEAHDSNHKLIKKWKGRFAGRKTEAGQEEARKVVMRTTNVSITGVRWNGRRENSPIGQIG